MKNPLLLLVQLISILYSYYEPFKKIYAKKLKKFQKKYICRKVSN